jgi:hypothetical protein
LRLATATRALKILSLVLSLWRRCFACSPESLTYVSSSGLAHFAPCHSNKGFENSFFGLVTVAALLRLLARITDLCQLIGTCALCALPKQQGL